MRKEKSPFKKEKFENPIPYSPKLQMKMSDILSIWSNILAQGSQENTLKFAQDLQELSEFLNNYEFASERYINIDNKYYISQKITKKTPRKEVKGRTYVQNPFTGRWTPEYALPRGRKKNK